MLLTKLPADTGTCIVKVLVTIKHTILYNIPIWFKCVSFKKFNMCLIKYISINNDIYIYIYIYIYMYVGV